jgi:hypothetical protein
MRCSQVQRLSTVYLDGDLDVDRSSAVRGHLRRCAECSAIFDDEVAVRSIAGDLDDALDPPDSLWQRISDEVAVAEIRDARRSPWVLAWRRLRAAIEPYRLHLAAGLIAAAAVVALVVKSNRAPVVGHVEIANLPELAITAFAPPLFAASGSPPPTHYEQIAVEVERADERYASVVADLREIAASERTGWSAAAARRYDSAIARFDARVAETRRDLDRRIARNPAQRDPLYHMYREHIAFLEDAVWGKL